MEGEQSTVCVTQMPLLQVPTAAVVELTQVGVPQGLPSGLAGNEHTPVAGSHVATWQSSGGGQTTGIPTQTPLWQVSNWVQAFSSSQGVPSGWPVQSSSVAVGVGVGVALADPVGVPVGVGVSAGVWVGVGAPAGVLVGVAVADPHCPSEQVEGEQSTVCVTQVPAWHVPTAAVVAVRQTDVPQGLPSGLAGFEHTPVAASHVPASWQSSGGVQTTPAQRSTVPVPVGVAVSVGVFVPVGVGVGVPVGVGLAVARSVGVAVGVSVAVGPEAMVLV
jgi:hypothetical protein